MDFFTIRDLENLSGIKAHTIRVWEQRYNFLKPQRTASNIRYYDHEELKKLLNIALLHKYGYRISHINKMSDEEIHERLFSLTQPLACEERFVYQLIQAMTEMDMLSFEEVLDDYILTKGLKKAMQYVIFPFLEKVRLLWLTNHIHPVLEHLVTDIIRRKLIVAIDRVNTGLEKKMTFLLFLPEGEFNEVNSLYVYYLLKVKGIAVFYLGVNVTLEKAAALCKEQMIDYIYIHLTCITGNFQWNRFLSQVNECFRPVPAIISGPFMAKMTSKDLPDNVICKQSFADVLSFIQDC